VGNVTARPLTSAEEIREEMVRQLTSSVRWVESIAYIAAQGVGHCIEIGPKDVLTGLISRIHPEMKATACGTLAAIQALI
jgi:[acyl-carrier-protein] S-malonyltransferase